VDRVRAPRLLSSGTIRGRGSTLRLHVEARPPKGRHILVLKLKLIQDLGAYHQLPHAGDCPNALVLE